MSINSPIQVTVSDRFATEIRQLAKRYRRIRLDIQPVIDQLEAGELPGDQIPGIDYTLFKVRVKNSDAQRGKSGGYRVIYYLKTATLIILVTIYSKSDKSDITATEVREIITRAEAEFSTTKDVSEDSQIPGQET
jgi:mRNA-degrading endonuclease RelE of RelBE toxin-antitoxin system